MYKICVIGDVAVGKTSVVQRAVKDVFAIHQATIGYELSSDTVMLENGKSAILNFYDLAGDVTNIPQPRRHFQDCHCIILIYSIIEYNSYIHVMKWLAQAQEYYDKSEPMVVLVGNKCDLTEQRQVTTAQATELAKEKNFSIFMETSAKEGTNVMALKQAIAKELITLFSKEKLQEQAQKIDLAKGKTVSLAAPTPRTNKRIQEEQAKGCTC